MQALGVVEVCPSDLESLCRELLQANPRVIADIKEGDVRASPAGRVAQAPGTRLMYLLDTNVWVAMTSKLPPSPWPTAAPS
jgi:hypothetical protein